MPYITFSKSYSSSDDGSKLAGADLGQLETDISQILNGGITNVNISDSAAVVESKLAFDATSGHNHDGSNSRLISTGAFRGFIQGAELEWVSVATIKAQSGVMDIGGSLYTRTSYSTTLNMATDAHWVEGTSQEGADQWVYIYAYNDSGSTWDIKFWLQPPQYANTGTDDSSRLLYRSTAGVWYRCLGAIRNNAGSDLLNFFQMNDIIMYHDYITITAVESVGAWSAAISCASAIPAISTFGYFGIQQNDNTGNINAKAIKANGTTKTAPSNNIATDLVDNYAGGGLVWCPTDTSQQISNYDLRGGGATNPHISVLGYKLNIR